MPHEPKHFVVTDPTGYDGDPFEVAERAVRHAGATAAIYRNALLAAKPMVRNAEMDRQIHATGAADAEAFDESALAKRLDALVAEAEAAVRTCTLLSRAAGFDPKHPPKE
jgi:putative heme iron utilization protein